MSAAISPDQSLIYVVYQGDDRFQEGLVSVQNTTLLNGVDIMEGTATLHSVAVSPDGSKVYRELA